MRVGGRRGIDGKVGTSVACCNAQASHNPDAQSQGHDANTPRRVAQPKRRFWSGVLSEILASVLTVLLIVAGLAYVGDSATSLLPGEPRAVLHERIAVPLRAMR